MNFIDRMDFKYTISAKQLLFVLNKIEPYYKVLAVNDFRYTDYNTEYFDTHDFSFYKKHHNGLSNRFKARIREYVQSKLYFLEVKYKNNKGWTSKYREKIKQDDNEIIDKFKKLTHEQVEKKLIVRYTRITFVAKDASEKVTMDLNLTYSANHIEKQFGDIVIIEVKSKNRKRNLLRQILKDLGYKEQGMSKYCFGITQMYDQVKTNNFKTLIKDIKKKVEYEFEHS